MHRLPDVDCTLEVTCREGEGGGQCKKDGVLSIPKVVLVRVRVFSSKMSTLLWDMCMYPYFLMVPVRGFLLMPATPSFLNGVKCRLGGKMKIVVCRLC